MEETVSTVTQISGSTLAIIGAVLAAALAGAGSSIGVFTAGKKGAGVLSEKTHLFGKILVLTSLPGSQGVYGLLIALLTINKIAGAEVSYNDGMQLLLAGLVIGLLGFASSVFQGKVVAASIGTVAKQEDMSGKAIVLSVIIETYAIFGLLVAIFILNAITL